MYGGVLLVNVAVYTYTVVCYSYTNADVLPEAVRKKLELLQQVLPQVVSTLKS